MAECDKTKNKVTSEGKSQNNKDDIQSPDESDNKTDEGRNKVIIHNLFETVEFIHLYIDISCIHYFLLMFSSSL